jgi:hypothetical protein
MIMRDVRMIVALGAGGTALLLLAAAALPSALAQTRPGLWEIEGLPHGGHLVRQCLANTALLARVEHSGQACKQVVISDTETTTVIEYSCRNGGFGRSKMTLLTPRSLRIETQGISANYPFNYVIQARRVGDCAAH